MIAGRFTCPVCGKVAPHSLGPCGWACEICFNLRGPVVGPHEKEGEMRNEETGGNVGNVPDGADCGVEPENGPELPAEAKRTRSLGTLRAVLVPYPDVFMVVPGSPPFGTIDECQAWLRANAIDGPTYGWIRVGTTVKFQSRREVVA